MIEIIKGLYEEGIKELKLSTVIEGDEKALIKLIDATIVDIICKKIETEMYNKGKYNKKAINELIDFINEEKIRELIKRRIKEIK